MWKKDIDFKNVYHMDFLLIGITFLIVGGIYFKWSILLAFVLLFFGYFMLNGLYDRQLDKKLFMENERKTIRLFPGETTELSFVFDNSSIFPYLNGVFRFQSGSAINSTDYIQSEGSYLHTYEVPLTIAAQGRTTLKVPIESQKRGTVTLRNIHFKFSHLTNFTTSALTYNQFYYQEVLVYPKPQQVAGIENLIKMNQGTAPANIAMFEDAQTRIGIRSYQMGDPFYRINWKATAKVQELQTNVYEKVMDKSYVFIVNIGSTQSFSGGSTSSQLEDLLSYTAYLCQYAYKNNLPFSMYINARKFGGNARNGFVQLYEGEGSAHYIQALDMLARIHTQGMVLPFEQMLMRIDSQSMQSKTTVIIGETSSQSHHILAEWSRRTGVYRVNGGDEFAMLERFTREEIASGQ